MAFKIKWTKKASHTLHEIINHIDHRWGEQSVDKFVSKVSSILEVIRKNPEIGKIVVKEKGIRGFVLAKQTTLFYRIKGNNIILLSFFDNRQHPEKRFGS